MNKEKIDFILKQGEGFKIEFKENFDSKSLAKEIVAFANSEGGRIFLGISDKGEMKGIEISNKLKSQIQDIARNCDPVVKINLEHFDNILIINVLEGNNKPYQCASGFFVREGPNSQKLSRDEIIEFIQQSNKIKFDKSICLNAIIKEIDKEKLKSFLITAKNERNLDINPNSEVIEALTRLHLIKNGRLTNAAVLLFAKDSQKFFLNSKIRCARFKGTEALDFIDMKVLKGTLIELRENAIKFVLQHIKHSVYFDANKRYDKWEYPIRAIEEAITNALAHRDYYSSSEIQLSIFDDRIEIWNPGELLKPLTLEDLKKEHQSIPRNELIADSLFLVKYIEKWGTGTNRIVKEMVDYKLPEPIFMIQGGSFVVKLIGPGKRFEEEIEKEKIHSLDINERQKKAIKYVKGKGSISIIKYMSMCNVSDKTTRRDLNNLVKKGIFMKEGSTTNLKFKLRSTSVNFGQNE